MDREQLQGFDGSSRGGAPAVRVRAIAGTAGDRHDATKVLKGFGGTGVLEVLEDGEGGTYRAIYTVKFPEAVFVRHCCQKKSKRGIATPKEDMDTIIARLKIAEAYVKGLRK